MTAKDAMSWMLVALLVLVLVGVGLLLWFGFADLFRWQNPFKPSSSSLHSL